MNQKSNEPQPVKKYWMARIIIFLTCFMVTLLLLTIKTTGDNAPIKNIFYLIQLIPLIIGFFVLIGKIKIEWLKKNTGGIILFTILFVFFNFIPVWMGATDEVSIQEITGKISSIEHQDNLLTGSRTIIFFSDGQKLIVSGDYILKVGSSYTISYKAHTNLPGKDKIISAQEIDQ